MSVTLRIWRLKLSSGNIGHASLEVNNSRYRYMSVWPSGRMDNKGAAFSKSDDFSAEGGEAYYKETFYNLYEEAMIKEWDLLKSTNSLTYSNYMYGFNCMTNAAMLLTCGAGLDPIDNWYRFCTIQEHFSLYCFAKGMKWGGW